ncbi:thiamine-binding protein [Roseivirga sp.]|uniref:thiamine-binding protein n=1 Tax=Roseivirga sp. TaxID=1964215 RepID=UPI003B8DCE74
MHQINLGIQVVPIATADQGYPIIDKCISLIQKSGIPYTVTPFETVLEGNYQDIMSLVNDIYEKANTLSPETVINIRIHSKQNEDVVAKDKTEKF